ncbi:MAG: pyruvate dehydrogenase [Chloroflexi bacterium]|nr:pyruvate dehydrogenase [Chloroflexota bacterium]
MQMVYHANKERPNTDGAKVGGHQASSASVVTVLTSLFFEFMGPGDRISIKPHASPVFHAIQYLLGNLDGRYLKTLREFHGLQSYPSRTKDPDPVDFSTGSVGLGSIAPNFAEVAEQYVRSHFKGTSAHPPRYISLVGDGELDEGSIWEAITEPVLQGGANVLWVVDLNRQSLDRVIPGIRVQTWRKMFAANGWRVIDAKYGAKLEAAFTEPGGLLLRDCIDEMPNDVYQPLLRLSPTALADILPNWSQDPDGLRRFIQGREPATLKELFGDLGGHDFSVLRRAFADAGSGPGPCVVFAYTLKGWRTPMEGDPENHSIVLNAEDMSRLRQSLGVAEEETWATFGPDSEAGRLCAERGRSLRSASAPKAPPAEIKAPTSLGRAFKGSMSTQQAFGLVLADLAREDPRLAERIVTVSPDVATSTNLGGWISRMGVWSRQEKDPLPQGAASRLVQWKESPQGHHIELGISESDLFLLLGQLGVSAETQGELVFPIGTLYDPFVCRALESFLYGAYVGSRFIVVGTPSGITLSPEGGLHQSFLTPSIGIEMPGIWAYEPCFAQELEWVLFWGLDMVRRREASTYLRLSTKDVDQGLFPDTADVSARESLRQQVLSGGYRLVDVRDTQGYRPGENAVHIFATGVMVPEAVEASRLLAKEGVFANVVNVTSAGRLFQRYQQWCAGVGSGRGGAPPFLSDILSQPERRAPVVTVADGHPHSLAWIGSALGTFALPLGVSQFGQSGARDDLYREYGIDVSSIMAACYGALEAGET